MSDATTTSVSTVKQEEIGKEMAQTIDIENMPIEDVRDVELQLYEDVKRKVSKRVDIVGHLSKLYSSPDELRIVLDASRSFVGGSFATEFFLPGIMTEHSDIDIFTCGGSFQRMVLLDWAKKLGFKGTISDVDYPNSMFSVMEGKINTPMGQKVLQLIHVPDGSPTETVMRFHSTIAMCYIDHEEAVSITPASTRRKMTCDKWPRNDEISPVKKEKLLERGVKFISKSELYRLHGMNDTRFPLVTRPFCLKFKNSSEYTKSRRSRLKSKYSQVDSTNEVGRDFNHDMNEDENKWIDKQMIMSSYEAFCSRDKPVVEEKIENTDEENGCSDSESYFSKDVQ